MAFYGISLEELIIIFSVQLSLSVVGSDPMCCVFSQLHSSQ